jgi:hypothetical protein
MIRHPYAVTLAAVLLAALAGRAAEIDPYLPEDTESVLNLNVRQLLDSPLVKKHALALAQEALRDNDQVQDILKDLGFDPFKDLDRVVVATPAGTDKDRGLVIVRGRFDVAKFKAKADEAAKDSPDNLKIHKVLGGKHTLYEVIVPDLGDDSLFVALAGRDTLLVSFGKDYVVNALKKAGKTDPPALKNKNFQTLLEKLDDRQSVSLAVVKNADLQGAAGQLPPEIRKVVEKIEAIGGGLTISDEVKMEVVVTTKNAAAAKDIADSAKAGLNLLPGVLAVLVPESTPGAEFLVEFTKSLRVTSKGESVVFRGRISSDFIEDALKKKKEK